MSVGVPVSELLPYPALVVPFTYFFFKSRKAPDANASANLQDFFWRVGITEKYSRSLDSHLAQDLKYMDAILKGRRPAYEMEPNITTDYLLDNGYFAAGKAFIKTLLCLMATQRPLSFRDNMVVNISNDWLTRSNSKNYHHFFPKAFLAKKGYELRRSNHIANITLVDDQLNKQEIKDKPPSKYIPHFQSSNAALKKALASHLIAPEGFGIESDDYDLFLRKRCAKLTKALEAKLIRP